MDGGLRSDYEVNMNGEPCARKPACTVREGTERKGQFDFEAPINNYQASIDVNMPVNSDQWSARPTKEYFAKLPDGRYARFSIKFYAGDRNFIVFESYLNPKPGNRNLEFDPQKTVKVR